MMNILSGARTMYCQSDPGMCCLLASCFRNDFSLVSGPGFSRLGCPTLWPAQSFTRRSLLRLGAAELRLASVPRPSQARTKTHSSPL